MFPLFPIDANQASEEESMQPFRSPRDRGVSDRPRSDHDLSNVSMADACGHRGFEKTRFCVEVRLLNTGHIPIEALRCPLGWAHRYRSFAPVFCPRGTDNLDGVNQAICVFSV